MYEYMYIHEENMHMITYIFLLSRKPYQHHWNHSEECKLIYRVMQ